MFSTGRGGAGHHIRQTVSPMCRMGESECQPGECPCVRSRKCCASALNSSWGSERSPVRLVKVQFITILRKLRRPGSACSFAKTHAVFGINHLAAVAFCYNCPPCFDM